MRQERQSIRHPVSLEDMERAGGRVTTAEARRRIVRREVSDGCRQRKTLAREGLSHGQVGGNAMRTAIQAITYTAPTNERLRQLGRCTRHRPVQLVQHKGTMDACTTGVQRAQQGDTGGAQQRCMSTTGTAHQNMGLPPGASTRKSQHPHLPM
eukprot:394948-Hanusia_phi.AAC.1